MEHGKTKYYAKGLSQDYSRYYSKGPRLSAHANGTVNGMSARSSLWNLNRYDIGANWGTGAGAYNGFGNSNSSTAAASSSDTTSEAFKDWADSLYDYIKVKLDTLEKQTSHFYNVAENFISRTLTRNYSNAWKFMNAALTNINTQIKNNRLGYARYMEQSELVVQKAGKYLNGTAKSQFDDAVKWIKQGGIIDIKEYTDEDARTAIEEFKEWYNRCHLIQR